MSNIKRLKNLTILLLIIFYIIIYRLFIINDLLKYNEFINASVLMVILFLAIIFFGFQKDKYLPLKKQVNITVFIQILLFFSISYVIGFFVGFLRNSYSLTPSSIINNIFSPIIIIICVELIRYIILKSNKNNKLIIVLLTIVLIALELSTTIKAININDIAEIFKIATSTILPIIVKNCVLSYLTLKVGYKPALIYRLVMDLYVFIMPIVPNLGDYLNSMIGIGLPFIMYIYTSRYISEYENGAEYEFKKSAFQIADIPIVAFILLVVALISGYFPYYIIGIGSESMMPKISKGDAVVVKKVTDKSDLKEGVIIVYNNNRKSIVHRLVETKKKGNNIYYKTKGDANNTVDDVDILYDDIKGIVEFKIPYIAYPSVYLSEKLK